MPKDYSDCDYSFKIEFIGDDFVDKSCFLNSAVNRIFDPFLAPTVGFENFTFNTKIENIVIRLQIWDFCS